MILDKILNATVKAKSIMDAKYGDSWFIVHRSEAEGDSIEVKPKYVDEYDKYYESFYGIDNI